MASRSTVSSVLVLLSSVLALLLVVPSPAPSSATSSMVLPRGVHPDLASLYSQDPTLDGRQFSCLDGSQQIPLDQVNDDYCDCADGSDEPGTSACPNGKFYCSNRGFQPRVLPSSRVNDGICDCCDGSDEWLAASCPNTCDEMGREAREQREREQQVQRAGFAKKKELIQKGKELKGRRLQELSQMQQELERSQSVVDELERAKEAAVEQEKIALDEFNRIKDEERQREEELKAAEDAMAAETTFDEIDTNRDGMLDKAEMLASAHFDQNKDGQVTEEEVNFFLSSETEYAKADFLSTGWPMLKIHAQTAQKETPEPKVTGEENVEGVGQVVPEQQHDGDDLGAGMPEEEEAPYYDEELEEEELEDEELEEEERSDRQRDLLREGRGGRDLSEYDPATRALVEAADSARSAFEDEKSKVRDLEGKISSLKTVTELDLGEDEEFAPLRDQCYDFQDNEYTYTLCPFDRCIQKPKHGGGETRLGGWDHWVLSETGGEYAGMQYSDGQACWNGPKRSTRVWLKCGVEERLLSVSEPSKCEYEFHFETATVCSDPDKASFGRAPHDEL